MVWTWRPSLLISNLDKELFTRFNGPCLGEQMKYLQDCGEQWFLEGHRPPIVKKKPSKSNTSSTIENLLNQKSDFSYSGTPQENELL